MQEPLVELGEVDPAWDRSRSTEFESQDKEILAQLILEHLNTEEEKAIGSSMLRLTGHILFTW